MWVLAKLNRPPTSSLRAALGAVTERVATSMNPQCVGLHTKAQTWCRLVPAVWQDEAAGFRLPIGEYDDRN
jgi:hypothetical protein